MLITDDIFQAFLQCETKAHLQRAGATGDQQEFPAWERHRVEAYKRHYHLRVRADCHEDECLVGVTWPHDLSHSLWRLVLDCRVQTPALQSHIHIVERGTSAGQTPHPPYIPGRLIPGEPPRFPPPLRATTARTNAYYRPPAHPVWSFLSRNALALGICSLCTTS